MIPGISTVIAVRFVVVPGIFSSDPSGLPWALEKRLRVADMRVSYQKNTPGITIDPVDKAPQSRRSGAGVEASIDASTVALQRPKTGA